MMCFDVPFWIWLLQINCAKTSNVCLQGPPPILPAKTATKKSSKHNFGQSASQRNPTALLLHPFLQHPTHPPDRNNKHRTPSGPVPVQRRLFLFCRRCAIFCQPSSHLLQAFSNLAVYWGGVVGHAPFLCTGVLCSARKRQTPRGSGGFCI